MPALRWGCLLRLALPVLRCDEAIPPWTDFKGVRSESSTRRGMTDPDRNALGQRYTLVGVFSRGARSCRRAVDGIADGESDTRFAARG